MRCLSLVKSGQHFLQDMKEIHDEPHPHSTYFNALKSPRRMEMIVALAVQSYAIHSEQLSKQCVDYLKSYPELDGYTVEATDGHFMDHACHTKKGDNGITYAAGFIYSQNMRNGLLRGLCPVTNGTIRHHEIPVLRHHIQSQKKSPAAKNLYVYDKAVIDYAWWQAQERNNNFMISVLKENSTATFVESISFDKDDKANVGVEEYAVYQSSKATFRVIHYRDPETGILHRFITTLSSSFRPGIIALLYYKRWTIEKAFNNSKSDLNEKKAWSSDLNALKNQMHFTTMAYNLLRVLEETSKTSTPDLIHPSDKKYTQALKKRQLLAEAKSGFVNPLLFCKRISRISSQTIRTVQSSLINGASWLGIMDALVARFVPRPRLLVEH
jgi:hypothetical protein